VPAAVAEHSYDFGRNPRKMYLLERNRLMSVLTAYPGPLLRRALPVVLLTEPLLLVLAARDGWAAEKVAGWWWLLRNLPHLVRRRRRVLRRDPTALDHVLVTRLAARQVQAPPGLPLLDRAITRYWRAVSDTGPAR
jgi:hypothetical protein